MYVCNMVTQPGETENYKVSDHIKLLNQHLRKRKIDVVIANEEDCQKSLGIEWKVNVEAGALERDQYNALSKRRSRNCLL